MLKRLWRGELGLAETFWIWAVFGGLIVNLATSGMFLALIMADRPTAALIAGYGPSLPYNAFVTVGVLRAAVHYSGERHWADLARIATVTGMTVLSLS